MNDTSMYSGSTITILNPVSYGFSDEISNFSKKNKRRKIKLEKKYDVTSMSPISMSLSLSPTKSRKSKREGEENYKSGRWQPEEHQKFLEAIVQFGNEWKKVEEYVGSRSSTQARSHAQKFFVKIKRTNLLDLDINLNKSSIRSLQEVGNQMNSEEYLKTISRLKNVAYEKKSSNLLNLKRKNDGNDKEIIESLSSKFKILTSTQVTSLSQKMKNIDQENNINSNFNEGNFYIEAITASQQNKSLNSSKSPPNKKLIVPSNIKVFKMQQKVTQKESNKNKTSTLLTQNIGNTKESSLDLHIDENKNKMKNNSIDNYNSSGPQRNSKRSRNNSIDNINSMWESSYNICNQTNNTNNKDVNIFNSSNLLPKFEEDHHLNSFFLDPFKNDKNIHTVDFPLLEKELGNFNNTTQPFNISAQNNKDIIFNIDNLFSIDVNKNLGKDNLDFEI
jgi:SHAQKYF class myb-like DNA-binding protein